MEKLKNRKRVYGFTLVEMVISILAIGIILIAFAVLFILYQRGSNRANEYAEAQQNSRVALDFITMYLRQAGANTDYFRGQPVIAYAGPYQVVFNADIDNGQPINGLPPLTAMKRSCTPNTVPPSGTILYSPAADYDSDAETVVITIDSNMDGVVSKADRGDDPEETGENTNLFVLKMYTYGYNGAGANEVRKSNLALVRGPNFSPTWTIPQPLFQYFYDHDDDPTTQDILWGDNDGNGRLDSGEIVALTAMPSNLLNKIKKIKITAISESNRYDKRYETNGGFLNVTMTSEIYLRNASKTGCLVTGTVFHDADSDGVLDPGESGIPHVEVRLAGQNRSVLTDNYGKYFFPLPPGNYSIQEVDPIGYNSTTPNLVSLSLAAGQTKVVNFGDLASTPVGVINGVVFEDFDMDGVQDLDEPGIAGVVISLDDGTKVQTDNTGYYSFIAKQGTYTVIETDPVGYSSTTPNSQTANIVSAGDTVRVNFGDYAGPVQGTLEGYVFIDENEDGVRTIGEEGLPNVTIKVSNGDSTRTNADGYYRFNLSPGIYTVTEVDPEGYTSTTVNTYAGVTITADTLVVRNFGDILESRYDFVEIHIANTDRVLSVSAADLKEDERFDPDIILGTTLVSGYGNMLVFLNKWKSHTTPVSELFDPDPDYRRDAGDNINAMSTQDLTGDGVPDVITGLDNSTAANIQVWVTGDGGIIGNFPDEVYLSTGVNEVLDNKLADLDGDGEPDLIVGLKSALNPFVGAIETFKGYGNGSFASGEYITKAGPGNEYDLGAVWGVETGDIDGDGDPDVIVGSKTNYYQGYIDIYKNNGAGHLQWYARYLSSGAVNDIKVVDMKEDDNNDPDIIAGTSTGDNSGLVLLWLNEGGVFGVPDTTGYVFEEGVTERWPSDYVVGNGEVLSLGILRVNNDIFPDIAYGTRSSSLYTGDIYILPAYGTLPISGRKINQTSSGEIITMDVADFNKDGRADIVVGTRASATQGKLIVYFGREL